MSKGIFFKPQKAVLNLLLLKTETKLPRSDSHVHTNPLPVD